MNENRSIEFSIKSLRGGVCLLFLLSRVDGYQGEQGNVSDQLDQLVDQIAIITEKAHINCTQKKHIKNVESDHDMFLNHCGLGTLKMEKKHIKFNGKSTYS